MIIAGKRVIGSEKVNGQQGVYKLPTNYQLN